MNRNQIRSKAKFYYENDSEIINEYAGKTKWISALVAVLCEEYNNNIQGDNASYSDLCKYFNFPKVYSTSYGFEEMIVKIFGDYKEKKVISNE